MPRNLKIRDLGKSLEVRPYLMSPQPIKVSSRQSLHNQWCPCLLASALTPIYNLHVANNRFLSLIETTLQNVANKRFLSLIKNGLQNVANKRIMSLIKHNSAECCEQQIYVTHQKQLCRMLWTTYLCYSSKITAECCKQENYVTHPKHLCRTSDFCINQKQLCRMLRTTNCCHSSKTTLQNVANSRFLLIIKNNSADCWEQPISVTHQKQHCRMLRITDFCHSSNTTLQNVANNIFRFMLLIKNNSAECCEQQIYATHQKQH